MHPSNSLALTQINRKFWVVGFFCDSLNARPPVMARARPTAKTRPLAGKHTRLEHSSFSISEANVRFWHKAGVAEAFGCKAVIDWMHLNVRF
jgi:hypothetical protein